MITRLNERTFVRKNGMDDDPLRIEITSLGIEIDGEIIDWHDIFKGIVHQSKVDPMFKHELKDIIAKL